MDYSNYLIVIYYYAYYYGYIYTSYVLATTDSNFYIKNNLNYLFNYITTVIKF